MKRYLFAAIVASAGMGMATTTTIAADLPPDDSYSNYSSRSDSPYDDPRYASLYGRSEAKDLPRGRSYRSSRSERNHSYSTTTESRQCQRPNDATHVHSTYSSSSNYSRGCLSKYEIRRQLKDQGWRGFELIRARPNVAVLKARQPDGDLYKIRVDRCSGEVLRARIIDSYRHRDRYRRGDYAYSRARRYKTY